MPAIETGQRRLEIEIRAKRNNILTALDILKEHPNSKQVRISDVRHDLAILQGMVYAWFYMTAKYARALPISLTDDMNKLAMYWLSVDLIKMRDQAYPKPKPQPEQEQDADAG